MNKQTNEGLRKLFNENSDCYYDENLPIYEFEVSNGDYTPAMTESKFIQVVTELLSTQKMGVDGDGWISSEDATFKNGYYWIRLRFDGDEFVAYYAEHKEAFSDNDGQLFPVESIADYSPITKPSHQPEPIK